MKRIRIVSCGCCSNGCVCWNHQDVPMGMPWRVCDFHKLNAHPKITGEETYREGEEAVARLMDGVPWDGDAFSKY